MKIRPDSAGERRRRILPSVLGTFLRNRRGATAIEFGILALPFCLLLFAIFESCISFAAGQILANAADDVARQLRTGQIKAADMNEAVLKAKICNDLKIIVSGCPGTDLLVDLQEYATFELAAQVKTKYTSDNDIDAIQNGFTVKPGGAQTKNMLRVYYKWPVMTDFLRAQMSTLKGGKTLQFAEVVWQNEPYPE